jgi:hypothetical protein
MAATDSAKRLSPTTLTYPKDNCNQAIWRRGYKQSTNDDSKQDGSPTGRKARSRRLCGSLIRLQGYATDLLLFQSIVYSATERESGRITALKKSRVSLRVKRTLLKHEARVLRYLSGHPSIPEVFAYGRIKHFEFLSMQLLHRSLGDIIDEEGPLSLATVLGLADQLVSRIVLQI